MTFLQIYVDFLAKRPTAYLMVMFLAFVGLIYYGIGALSGTLPI